MKLRRRIVLLMMLGKALFLAGCGGNSGPPPIYVGHVATLSGPGKEDGEKAVLGIRLAVQEQVKQAQENSRPIHVRHTDTRGKLEAFEGEAIRLVALSRVIALLGGSSLEEIARLAKAQVPLLGLSGSQPQGLSELVFLTGLSPAFQGKILARFAREELKVPNLVVLVDERREESLALAKAFARSFWRAGEGKKIGKDPSPPRTWRYGKEQPLSDWGKRLAEEKPAALLLAGTSLDLARLLKDLRPAPAVILFGGEEGSARTLLEAPETAGFYLVTAFAGDADGPRAREFLASYVKSFGQEPDVQAALAYDAARLLLEAVARCRHDLTSDRLVGELAQLQDFPGLTGSLSFGPDRQLRRPALVARMGKGRMKTVKKYEAEGPEKN